MTIVRPTNLPEFDPFNDRLCRDVRNELSRSFIESIETGAQNFALSTARHLKSNSTNPVIQNYIENRLTRYNTVVENMDQAGILKTETYAIALLLWDLELFFEVHEWLEKEWFKASGTKKIILQALIRAAGTYILSRHGRIRGSRKMAQKALYTLTKYKEELPSFLNIERMLDGLQHPELAPAKLGAEKYIAQRISE